MTEVTKDSETKRKFTTMTIPTDVLSELHEKTIVPKEPPYSVIERLLEMYDIKIMQKVVSKRVR
jgi:hypothetical protein